MIYYARAIEDRYWSDSSADPCDISGEAVCFNLDCADNEWSVYKIEDEANESVLEAIVVRCFCLMTKKCLSGITLALISEKFIEDNEWKVDPDFSEDKADIAGQLHHEIKDVTLEKIYLLSTYIGGLFCEEIGAVQLRPFPINKVFEVLVRNKTILCGLLSNRRVSDRVYNELRGTLQKFENLDGYKALLNMVRNAMKKK